MVRNNKDLAALADLAEEEPTVSIAEPLVPPPPPLATMAAPPPLMGAYDAEVSNGLAGAAAQLEELTPLALMRWREVLNTPVDLSALKEAKLIAETAAMVINATLKVDEGRLKARKLDVLPRLLEIVAREERMMGRVIEAAL